MIISWTEITSLIMSIAALVTVGIAVLKGRKERANLDAEASDSYAQAAKTVADLYKVNLQELKDQQKTQGEAIGRLLEMNDKQGNDINTLKAEKRILQDQLDAQDVKLNTQAAEILIVKKDNRILRHWIELLCVQIREAGKEPIPCPEDVV